MFAEVENEFRTAGLAAVILSLVGVVGAGLKYAWEEYKKYRAGRSDARRQHEVLVRTERKEERRDLVAHLELAVERLAGEVKAQDEEIVSLRERVRVLEVKEARYEAHTQYLEELLRHRRVPYRPMTDPAGRPDP